MSEARLWSYLRDGMGSAWEAQRHEDRHSTGIPDVSYSIDCHGWIELKFVRSLPKKPNSILKIDHFTPDQRNWLTRHGRRGGKCFILIQVDRSYLLFSWEVAGSIGRVTFEELRGLSMAEWYGSIVFPELVRLLSRG